MTKDLIIIGAGPGGYELALAASKKGLSTLLIEEKAVGGTCLHHGCIPTKTLYHSAKILKDIKSYSEFGICSNYEFDYLKAREKKNEVVNTLHSGINFQLKTQKVETIYGRAKLISKNEVEVNEEVYSANFIVIATGSSSINLRLPGFDNKNVVSSTEMLNINEVPKNLVVIGGGVIGIELASIFKYYGSNVEVIEAQDRILPMIDKEVSKRLTAYLKNSGIKIYTSSSVVGIEDNKVYFNSKGEIIHTVYDKVLVSVGRRPNVDGLGLEDVGINYSHKGIEVDNNFKTNIDNIYAIGDVTGKMMLAHTATYSGYKVLSHILGEDRAIDFNLIPNCVFTFPEVASIGLTEDEAKGVDYKVNKFLFKANGKAHTIGESDGFVKIISFADKILGVHILGPNASDIIHEAAILMNADIGIEKAKNIIFAHPTLSETFGGCILEI
ncbi:MAG: dihydrolipoyl dehydrogenase [Bacilli bacterium]|nr:dihydrolipoyl dehydrogenase [Bacilli bacterium]